jgi:hypothetical protein
MADDSEINILLNDLNSIMNNILAIDENPDNPNVTWLTIHASITAAIQDMDEIGQQMDEDAILMQDVIDGMLFVAVNADEAEEDGNTNDLRIRLQDVIDAVQDLPRVNENEGIGGYRKRTYRKHRKHRTHRKRKDRTQRKRNRRRTHRNRK